MIVLLIAGAANTQDGKWKGFYGSPVGTERGDAVQLKYYKDKTSEGEDEFPAGTCIGFVLKTNGWAGKGDSYATSGFEGIKNFWAASTTGLTLNWDGNNNGIGTGSHTATYTYVNNKNSYQIVSFEDYFNDTNFSDVSFAMKGAFKDGPIVTDKTITTEGIYAYEDLWPNKCDYDLNDVLVKCTKSTLKSDFGKDNGFKIINDTVTFKTFHNYAVKNNGLGVRMGNIDGAENVKFEIKTKADNDFKETTFTKEDDNVYLITDNVNTDDNVEYRLTFEYPSGKDKDITVEPFIYRAEAGKTTRWEVHIPNEAPTAKMDMSLFGTGDDKSVPNNKTYYVRSGNYPFAFYLAGATEEDVAKLLDKDNESKPIDNLYSGFKSWATSKGTTDTDWYKK